MTYNFAIDTKPIKGKNLKILLESKGYRVFTLSEPDENGIIRMSAPIAIWPAPKWLTLIDWC